MSATGLLVAPLGSRPACALPAGLDPIPRPSAERFARMVAYLRGAAFDDGRLVALEARDVAIDYVREEIPEACRAAWLEGFDLGARERARLLEEGRAVDRPGVALRRTAWGLVLRAPRRPAA